MKLSFNKAGIAALSFCCVVLFFSCKKGKEMVTDSGFRYILYTESKGQKAKVGDYVTIQMTYRNEKDSVLFDSRSNKLPLRFELLKIPFKGSFEEGLTYMAENDSATFFVPADSLYTFLYAQKKATMVPQEQTAFIAGTFVKFDIRLLRIQNYVEAEQEMAMEMSDKEKQENKSLNEYIYRQNITSGFDSSGYYLIMRAHGSGNTIDSGKIVTVDYEGRFLNGEVFDGTRKAGQPYRFMSGAHHVIKGWELAMKKLRAGDKITLIVPSKLGFGEEGIRDPSNGTFIVPPYSSLIFDMDILSVEDTPPITGK